MVEFSTLHDFFLIMMMVYGWAMNSSVFSRKIPLPAAKRTVLCDDNATKKTPMGPQQLEKS
jgi:hypothetical protein